MLFHQMLFVKALPTGTIINLAQFPTSPPDTPVYHPRQNTPPASFILYMPQRSLYVIRNGL